MSFNKSFVICWFLMCKLSGSAQWCCVDSSQLIKDETTVTLRLQISGAVNNNLADPTQGVCGVRVKFEHRFIGDVTMELISPAGQRIKLTGPVGNSGRSDFTKWFISFVPCASQPVPDLGFKPKWDNIQSWGILGKFYNGTYHPFQGCLEDFNSGAVNGTWTLAITDDERFYEGKVESFCLLFCDQNGISCIDCSPNGGVFAIEAKSFCATDPGLNLPDRIQFPFLHPT
ncbi:MAG: proprotein convertase P-domain-containing protein [Saprospiraceae bacterium]|nr:proprotein convertase P-domain-containing protein [Saprospiraceae bacterium]